MLQRARDEIDDSALRERLDTQANQLARLADRSPGPDHGRMARHQGKPQTINEDAGGALDDYIDEATQLINVYRETVEGG